MLSFLPVGHADKKGYWINELESLGISSKEIERIMKVNLNVSRNLPIMWKISNRHYTQNTKLPIVKR